MMVKRSTLTAAFAAALLLLGVAAADASGTKAVQVSRCGSYNAEVVQAVDGSYVYEAWIGCFGIGFARSVDGGKTFGPSQTVRGSVVTGGYPWDPAIAVGPDGTVYVAFMVGPRDAFHSSEPMTPAVAVSRSHGRSFGSVSTLQVPASDHPNWGDRPFIAVGPDGTVYVTWDYGPRRDEVKLACSRGGSCSYAEGDFNAVLQKSLDGGKTWTDLAPISPDYPLGGVYSAPIVAEPNGALDVLYEQFPTDPNTLAVSPGHEDFIRSTDGGDNWSQPVPVGPEAGKLSLKEWWIDGSIAVDSGGTLYAGWDTQRQGRDTAWLAWSTDNGANWSSPLKVASSRTEHLTEVAAVGPGSVYVGWQTVVHDKGYATFLHRYVVGHGWTSSAKRVSPAYGKPAFWPGDTFGLSARNGAALLSWGSAIGKQPASEIWFAKAKLPSG